MASGLKYKFGLINSSGKYLTAEKFGGKVNASGTTLKAKQVWTLEQDESISYLKSPSGNYLSADKNGNVACDTENRSDSKDVGFEIELQDDGKWALKNVVHKRYIGCNGDELTCTASSTSDPSVNWNVQLAIHPQVCMRNDRNKCYAHLKTNEDGEDSIVVDERLPWGADSTLTLVYFGQGKYALEAFNGKFVQCDGELVTSATDKAQYTLIFKAGHLALKDISGKYLGVVSGSKMMKSSTKATLTSENYFDLEDSCPQGAFVYGERFASLKQGDDVSFKPHTDEITDTETFQLEFVKTDTYAIRVCDPSKTSKDAGRYWKRYATGIQANGSSKDSDDCQFGVEYDGKNMFLRVSDGKYVSVRDNGHLFIQDERKPFTFRLLNRPKLVLKCPHGFVGFRDGKPEVVCNRSNFDVFNVSYKDGGYTIQDAKGNFWSVDDSNRIVLGAAQGIFFLEYHELSKFAIRAESNGKLLKGEQSGLFTASADEVSTNTLWEF